MRRVTTYSFIISLVWLGMIIASGFLAAYGTVTVADPTWKSHVVFSRFVFLGVVQRAEWACCVLSWILLVRTKVVRERNAPLFLGVVTAMLVLQSMVLMPALALAANVGAVAAPWIEQTQLCSDALRVIALALLASSQIQSFARAIISE